MGTFKNTVESEIKGARSTGSFTLALQIMDDDSGEAVRAMWKVTREAGAAELSAKAATDAAKAERVAAEKDDDEKVFASVRRLARRGEHLSRTALRKHDERPIAVKRVTAALDRLIEVVRLRLVGSEVHLPEVPQETRQPP